MMTAFLESQIDEEPYLRLPKHFVISTGGKVKLEVHDLGGRAKKPNKPVGVKLKRSWYGLKQAGHN